MALMPFRKKVKNSTVEMSVVEKEAVDWVRVAAGGALLTSGILLLAGKKRAGMAAAVSGTALAMLDQQELLHSLWIQLPGYIDQVQEMISRAQDAVDDIAEKRDSLRRVLGRAPNPA